MKSREIWPDRKQINRIILDDVGEPVVDIYAPLKLVDTHQLFAVE